MDKKEEFLVLFSIALVLVACSSLIYLAKTASITGNIVVNDTNASLTIMSVLIVIAVIALVSSSVLVHRKHQELEKHKNAIPSKNILDDYVLRAEREGFTSKQITNRLKAHGWKQKEIEKHIGK